jgi:ribosomal protein S27AE
MRKAKDNCPMCDDGTIVAFDDKKLANGFACDTCPNEFHRNL